MISYSPSKTDFNKYIMIWSNECQKSKKKLSNQADKITNSYLNYDKNNLCDIVDNIVFEKLFK